MPAIAGFLELGEYLVRSLKLMRAAFSMVLASSCWVKRFEPRPNMVVLHSFLWGRAKWSPHPTSCRLIAPRYSANAASRAVNMYVHFSF